MNRLFFLFAIFSVLCGCGADKFDFYREEYWDCYDTFDLYVELQSKCSAGQDTIVRIPDGVDREAYLDYLWWYGCPQRECAVTLDQLRRRLAESPPNCKQSPDWNERCVTFAVRALAGEFQP